MPEDPRKGLELVRSDRPSSSSLLDVLVDKLTPSSLDPRENLLDLRLPEAIEEKLQTHFDHYDVKISPGEVVDFYSDATRPVTLASSKEFEAVLLHIPKWIVGNDNNVGAVMEIQASLFKRTVRIVSPGCDNPELALSTMLTDWKEGAKEDRKIDADFVPWNWLEQLHKGKYNAARVFKLAIKKVPVADVAPPNPPATRDRVFVSYAGEDKQYLDLLQLQLKPLMRELKKKQPKLEKRPLIWSDEQIKAGTRWHDEINSSLAAAKVAVLLVSTHFLASDFINEDELPPILEAAKKEGLTILWVLLDDCNWEGSKIADYQAVEKPIKRLDSMEPDDQKVVLKKLSQMIVEELEK